MDALAESFSKLSVTSDVDKGMISLGHGKSVQVFKQHGRGMVDIRKYYRNRPTKKGITLSVAEWTLLMKDVPEINKRLKRV